MKKVRIYRMRTVQEQGFSLLMSIFGIIISFVALYPVYYVLIASFSRPFFVESGDVIFWFKGFNFESYRDAFAKDGIWVAYANTIFYTVFGVIVNMVFTTTMAYALSKKRLPFQKFFILMTIFTMWFSAGIIPLYMTFVDLGLLNTRTSLIVGFAINTYNLIILKSFFEQVPKSLEEAAHIDGASNLHIFWNVYLPLSKPALATVGMFYAVTRWNGYFWAMNLLKEDSKIPLQVLLKKLIVDRVANETEAGIVTMESLSSQTTVIYAIIIIAIIPMAIAYPFVQKYFKKGAVLGSIKG